MSCTIDDLWWDVKKISDELYDAMNDISKMKDSEIYNRLKEIRYKLVKLRVNITEIEIEMTKEEKIKNDGFKCSIRQN